MKEKVSGFLQPRVKGVATVSFDGEVVARRENFVSPRMLGSLATLGNRYLIAPRAANSAPAASGLLGTTSPFSGLVLTDFAQEPDPANEVAISGTALAGGSVNTAASGSSRGGFNTPESVFESGYQRLVWDFATNQANGTFQSIYLFPGGVDANTGIPNTVFPAVSGTVVPSFTTINKDGDWYYQTRSGVLYRFDFNNLLSYIGGYTYTEETLGTLNGTSGNSGAFVKDGTAYWVQSSSPYNIRSAPVTDLATFTNIRTHPAGSNYAGSSTGCPVSYWAEADGWVIGNRSTGASWAVAKLHNDFTDWEVYGTAGIGNLSNMSSCWGSTTTSTNVSTSGQVYAVSDVGWSVNQIWDRPSQSAFTFYPVGPNVGLAGASGGSGYPTVSNLFFSRALLEEPVTKTSVNTMKITYELVWG